MEHLTIVHAIEVSSVICFQSSSSNYIECRMEGTTDKPGSTIANQARVV
jgi:hypothetical protein